MKSLLTPLFSNFLINDIKDHFINDANTFIFIGRALDFGSNSANIPDIIWTTNERNQFYRNMVGAKKIQLADVQPVVSRVDWAVNTKYDSYEDNIEFKNTNSLVGHGYKFLVSKTGFINKACTPWYTNRIHGLVIVASSHEIL